MAYSGTTSTAPNVPFNVWSGIPRMNMWVYVSTHISSDVEAPNFFTDGNTLGMKVGDAFLSVGTTTYLIQSHAVVAVGSTTTQLSTGSTFAE